MTNKVDILHPYASLKWRKCRRLPVGTRHAQAVWLGDKLYVGGGMTSRCKRDHARLYIYTPTTDTWNDGIDTPVYWFAIITFNSQLVLVGGTGYVGEESNKPVTNKLWTLTEHDQWEETLPPMTTKRQCASALEFADNILVAGGEDDEGRVIDIVEVYSGHQWAKAQCLPKPCFWMKSTVLNGQWYLMGGYGQGEKVYYASLDSLVASCQPSEKPLPSVWKKLPDVPHDYSSTTVFGNRLIAVGGGGGYKSLSSSILAYSPHTQSWMHVGDTPLVQLGATCTVVLPTGELMVIGGWSDTSLWELCVHKASLYVTFDSDSHFTMEAIYYLEQIGTESLAELEAYKRPLQSIVGMEKVDLPTDNSFSFLEMWVQGYASLHPTWRHFFWALREIKLNYLADQIKALLSGVAMEQAATCTSNLDVSPGSEETEGREEDNKREQEIIISAEEEKHIAAVQKAMEERGMLDHTIVHGVFVGPARSGKNSLMKRLLGQMPSPVSPSTGVAESVVQVKVNKSTTFAANVKELLWSIVDYDDEAIRLICDSQDTVHQLEKLSLSHDHVPEVLNTTNSITNIDEIVHNHVSTSKTTVEEGISLTVQKDSLLVQDSSTQSEVWLMQHSDSQQHCRLPDSYVPPMDIVKLALRKKGKVPIEILQQDFQKTWSLYLTNTGGQMEFQEVLPLLVSGPSMFFFTFRLDRDLNERYVIEYELSDGTKVEPYTSSLTSIDGILQTLASIAAMGTFIYKGIQRSTVALRPKVFLVGTHKDQLDSKTAKEHIARVDKQLQEAIKSTAHYKDIIEFSSKGQLIFTVNNFSESDTDFKSIRLAVERIVNKREFQMTSPAHWFIFSLVLRKLEPNIISYRVAQEIAKQCGVFEDELKEALYFIHSKLGLIRYFPYEDVKNLVVIHPQFLFDKVTELIVDTFTFEEAGEHAANEFKHKGMFSLREFETISSRKNASIKPSPFAKLLERLRIAAPFQMDGNRMYFFPCVLAHTSMETPAHQLSTLCTPVPNLVITFKCGYCPKGLPGALLTYLMANEMKSVYHWTLCHDKIFRNQVSFKVGPLDTVVFKIWSTYLEIVFIPKNFKGRDSKCPKESVCFSICQAVDAGIEQVISDINYVNAQHSFTFPCGCKSGHPGQLELIDYEPFCLSCSKTGEQYKLPSGYELWQLYNAGREVTNLTKTYSHSKDSRDSEGTAPSVSPDGLNVSHSLPTKAELSWCLLPVEKQNGVITGYKIQVVGPDSSREFPIQGADATSVILSGLRPFTSYTFNVSAMTKAGTGPAATISSKTPEGAPSVAPGGLKISHSLPTKAELSWCPLPVEKQNGVITGYKVQVVEPDSSREMSVQEADTTSVEISDLRPITSYTFIVSAMTKAGTGPAATIPFKTSEGGPRYCGWWKNRAVVLFRIIIITVMIPGLISFLAATDRLWSENPVQEKPIEQNLPSCTFEELKVWFPDINPTTIQDITYLRQAVAEIGNWQSLCENLNVNRGIMDMLKYSNRHEDHKKSDCLDAYYDKGEATWEEVILAVAHYPLRKVRLAKNIAYRYLQKSNLTKLLEVLQSCN